MICYSDTTVNNTIYNLFLKLYDEQIKCPDISGRTVNIVVNIEAKTIAYLINFISVQTQSDRTALMYLSTSNLLR